MRTVTSLAVMAVLLLSSCVSQGSSTQSTIATSYATIVRPLVSVGIGAELDAGNIDEEKALQLNNLLAILGHILDGNVASPGATTTEEAWNILLPFALSGIDTRIASGEIGPGVGAALKEAVRLFGNRLLQLKEQV